MKRIVSGIMVTLLLVGMLTLASNVQPNKASGTIYIRADGSIDPPTAPIQRNGDLYTLTDDISSDTDGIIIEKDNITVDGAGYRVQGAGVYFTYGVNLTGRSNVTIENMQVSNFTTGIYLKDSSSNHIVGNKLTANYHEGIYFDGSSNYNSIIGNNIENNRMDGVFVASSLNNTISENNITANGYNGVTLWESLNNSISRNNITANSRAGVTLDESSNNNSIVGNTIINNYEEGIRVFFSSYNILSGNNIAGSLRGILLGGEIGFWDSEYNMIFENNITNNARGIWCWECGPNFVFHNNFVNSRNAYTYLAGNFWHDGYPSGGNYWSDYTGIDADGDGIGDTPYTIDVYNRDRYPLIHAWDSTFSEQQIVALVNGSRAYDYDLELENIAFGDYAFRAGGSIGANETANWIKGQFESFGLETWLEPFQFTTWDLSSEPSLLTDDDGDQGTTSDQIVISSFQCEHYSWPTPESGVFADLVVLPLPEAANRDELGTKTINMTEWNAIDTTGKVVLIGREVSWCQGGAGGSIFRNKIIAQPPAAILRTWWFDWMSFVPDFFNSAGGRPLSGLGPYYWNLHIPVGSVNHEDCVWIRNRENSMNVSAYVSVQAVIGSGTHYNVVGKIRGYENPEKLVIVSGHYDTVMCSGFCDNGAGTAGVIELANVFAEAVEKGIYKPRYTILFVAFTDEELYLVGSINFVKQHKSEMPNIIAVVNLDCIGSNEFYVTETNPVNGFDLDQTILDAAQDLGVPASTEPSAASDHYSFLNPSDADYWYNKYWGLTAGISDAQPVESSAMLDSYPLFYSNLWDMSEAGWIHSSYDNSTSTTTLNWVEVEDLENHIKVAALTIVRISPDTGQLIDVALLNITPFKTVLGQGYPVPINVTAENQGNYTGPYSITVYANTTAVSTFTNITITGGNSATITFTWNTTGFAKGNYTISAYAWPFPIETDKADNNCTDGWILITKVGDLGSAGGFFACDGAITGWDLALFIQCYNDLAPPQYMYLGDLGSAAGFFKCDGSCDGFDLGLFIQCYNNLGPPDP